MVMPCIRPCRMNSAIEPLFTKIIVASLWLNKPISKIIDSSKLYFKRIVVMGPD